MSAKPTIDELKDLYITSNLSLRELAEEHGYGHQYLLRQSAKHGWVELRKKGISRVSKKVVTKAIDTQAAHLNSLIETTDLLGDLIRKTMTHIYQSEEFDERRAATIGKAWNDYLKSDSLVKRTMTVNEEEQLNLAKRRQDNDDKRLEAELNKEKSDSADIEVVFSIQDDVGSVEECLG